MWVESGGEVEVESQAMTTEGRVEIQRVRERKRLRHLPFINPAVWAAGHPEAMGRHPNRALCLAPAPCGLAAMAESGSIPLPAR